MTDNEIIAEFMDGTTFDENGLCTDPEKKYSWRPGCYDPLRVEHLGYDKSWGWIMPVVEKLNDYGTWTIRPGFAMLYTPNMKFVKHIGDFEEQDGEAVKWVFIVACVCLDFIKWHNEKVER